MLLNYFKKKYYERKFKKLNIDEIKLFSFEGIKTYCYCANVYDGDTITIVFFYRKEPIKYKVRLYGIDTPELRTKDLKEKELGYKARDFLRELILDKTIQIEFKQYDKYGRILGILYHKNQNINNLMIENGHAKKYFGGTK